MSFPQILGIELKVHSLAQDGACSVCFLLQQSQLGSEAEGKCCEDKLEKPQSKAPERDVRLQVPYETM